MFMSPHLKRRQVSEGFYRNIVTGVRNDLGKHITIRPASIRLIYNKFDRSINRHNIRVVLNHWNELLRLLPEEALRLSLTIQQCANTGLTALIITGKAILSYLNFKLDIISELYRAEWATFEQAVRTVNGDPYSVFERNLDPVKSTGYKNLSWVPKEILIRIGGAGTLAYYAGWTPRARKQGTIDQLIVQYEANHTGVIKGREGMEA